MPPPGGGRSRRSGGGAGSLRLIERHARVYRHAWLVFASGIVEPLFYLLSIGLGLGVLVGNVPGPAGTYPLPRFRRAGPARRVLDERRHVRLDVQHLLPAEVRQALRRDAGHADAPGDVALGEIGWALLRGAIYAVAFILVMLALGLVLSAWAVLALPARC